MTHTLCRMLERENIATLSVTFGEMDALSRFYDNIVRPLIVVPIPSPLAYEEFSEATKSFKMSFSAWFVLFMPTPGGNATRDYCYNHPGNPFHLSFNDEMLTMCPYDFVLREWFSVDGNSTETFELAKWRPDGYSMKSAERVDMLTNLSLYERRNNLKGIVLRCVTVQASVAAVQCEWANRVGQLDRVSNMFPEFDAAHGQGQQSVWIFRQSDQRARERSELHYRNCGQLDRIRKLRCVDETLERGNADGGFGEGGHRVVGFLDDQRPTRLRRLHDSFADHQKRFGHEATGVLCGEMVRLLQGIPNAKFYAGTYLLT